MATKNNTTTGSIKSTLKQTIKQMELKKYLSFILFTIAVCVGFSSCSDDDKDEPNTGISQIIVGEWDSEFLGDASDINTNDLNVNDTQLGSVDSHLVFNSNGKGYEVDEWDGTKTEFSYTISAETIRMSAGNITQTHKVIKYSENVIYSLMESEQSIFKMVKRK